MPTLNVNHFLGDFDLDLNEQGEVDDDVRHAFTAGHCHSFALAVHDRFGWPMVGVGGGYEHEYEAPDGRILPARDVPDHVLILHPDLGLIDVEGEYGGTFGFEHEPVDPDDVRGGLDGWYRDAEPDVAALYVPAWAASLGLAA